MITHHIPGDATVVFVSGHTSATTQLTKTFRRVEMASQYSAKDGQKVNTDRQLEPRHIQTDSQLGPSPCQAGSEDRYDIQWLAFETL